MAGKKRRKGGASVPSGNRPKQGSNSGQFKKGQTGNPLGRPKSDLLQELASVAEQPVKPGGKRNCLALAEKAWEKAISDRSDALEWARWIANRLHGRTDLGINLNTKTETPVVLPPMTPEVMLALAESIRKLRECGE